MQNPNVEDIYLVTYRGWFGEGHGNFRLADGKVTGTDVGGGVYDGAYQWNEHTCSVDLDIDLRMLFPNIHVPDGKLRVPGEITRVRLSIPWHTLGQPFAVNLPTGPLMLTVKRIGEIRSAA
jgi:hypothetical protein